MYVRVDIDIDIDIGVISCTLWGHVTGSYYVC